MATQTLSTLRTLTREWVDDPAGDTFDSVRCDRAVRMAYNVIVNEVETSNQGFNIAADPIEISVTADAREYIVSTLSATQIAAGNVTAAADQVRKIIEVVRTDSGYSDPVRIIPMASRNAWYARRASYYPRLQRFAGSDDAVAIYRDSDGLWRLVFAGQEPEEQTLSVYYVPNIDTLPRDDSVPTFVPDDYHELIALRAGIILKTMENRDASGLVAMYGEELRLLRDGLASVRSRQRSTPI